MSNFGDIDNRKGYAYVEIGVTYNISEPFFLIRAEIISIYP